MNSIKKGKFIVFEGIDGCGKSTQAKKLKKYFEENSLPVFDTFEPTYGQTGTLLHNILTGEKKADPAVIAALFAADRLEHITDSNDGMLSRLGLGENVICDRYYFSSLAYQSGDLDPDWVYALNSKAASLLKPDIIFYLDISPSVALERINKGRETVEIYENLEKLTSVRENYLNFFKRFGKDENIVMLCGEESADKIFEEIKKAVIAS